jgi:hypothetical protein
MVAPRVFWGRSHHGSWCSSWSRQRGRVAGCFERTKRRGDRVQDRRQDRGSIAGSRSSRGLHSCRQKVRKRAGDHSARSRRGNPLAQFRTFRRQSPTFALVDFIRESVIDSSVPLPRASVASASSSAGAFPAACTLLAPSAPELPSPPTSSYLYRSLSIARLTRAYCSASSSMFMWLP